MILPLLAKYVEERAGARCEYCQMHQALQGATFHTEHVVPKSRQGVTDPANLALACPSCNLHKSDRIEVLDPDSQQVVALYNPRNQAWRERFSWEGYRLVALTPIARATIAALDLNSERRIRIRQAEEVFDLFPPP